MTARFLLLIVTGLLATWVPRGWGSQVSPSPERVPGRYQVTVWQDQDGLPQNTVTAITRTRDDYLWLGTVEGLVRFDGVRFTVFDHGNTPEIGNSHVTALLADRAGALWVGTAGGGLVRFWDGHFTREGPADEYVTCLHEDHAGALWVGTLARGVFCRQNGRSGVPEVAEKLRTDHVSALTGDAAGNLWVGTDRGVVRLQGDTATLYPVIRGGPGSDRVLALCVDGAGTVWAGSTAGLSRFTDGRFVPHELASRGLRPESVRAIREDRAGELWIGGQEGRVYRGRDGVFAGCPTQGDVPRNNVWALYPDREGELWVGTEGGGLIRLRDGRFKVLTARDGVQGDYMQAVFQDAAGVVWVGGTGGLSRFGDGRFSPGVPADDGPVARVKAIGQDRRRGTLWMIMAESRPGVYALREGRLDVLTDAWLAGVAISSLLGDRAGNLWVGGDRGLARIPAEGGEPGLQPVPEGTVAGPVVTLFEDRAGDLWVGTVTGGVTRFRPGGKPPTTWTTADGLASNHVLSFYEDRDGAMWIGTHGGGLCRFKDGRFVTITTRDGLYDDLAFAILEDDFGDLWMSGNKGIYRASLQELNDFADGRTRRVNSFTYGTADGMISRECNGGSPAGCKMRDGTLWFPTLRGVVVVDPSRRNLEPPRVRIEGAAVDRSPLPSGDPAAEVCLRPGQEDLEIRYTGLSWTRPQQIRFQYQLAGLNRGGWTDAGTGRTALFSRLPAGRYQFQVRADNGDGVWSLRPASLAVVVLPPFWQTWWFLTLAALGVAAAVGGGFWWRGEQLRRRYAVQQVFSRRLIAAHETERRRIAAELHDGLGQTLAMIKNSAVFGARGAAADDPALARKQLEQITEQSAHAIGEMREIAHNLRPYLLDRLGLTKALRSMLHQVADTSGLAFTVAVDDVDGRFAPDAEMSVYRMIQECLNNVLKHADASAVTVRVEAEPAAVHLTVQDDGRGFHAASAAFSGDGEGRGFGLMGLAERVRLLGGTHTVVSIPGQGTTVRIHLPAGMIATGKEA